MFPLSITRLNQGQTIAYINAMPTVPIAPQSLPVRVDSNR